MAYNQFLGLGGVSSGGDIASSSGRRGPKGDPGSFVWSFGNPPNVTQHFQLFSEPSEYVLLHRPIVPSVSDRVDVGTTDHRLGAVYATNVHANTLHFGNVSVQYDSASGRQAVMVDDAYQVFGVTTLRDQPDKIDPKLVDISGLRFIDAIHGDQDLHTLLLERPLVQSGDYFVVSTDGTLVYDRFLDESDRVASKGDILVYTLDRFVKIPFRVPNHGISTTHLTDGAVTSLKLADGAVTARHLVPGAVSSDKLEPSLDVQALHVRGQISSPSFSSLATTTDDPNANPSYGITFGNASQPLTEGTWRIRTTVESLQFQIWTGSRWVDKFELR